MDGKILEDTIINIAEIESKGACVLLSTPGVGEKFYGQSLRTGKFGIVKKSIDVKKYDNINEVLCYELGKLFGVNVCEASFEVYRGNPNYVLSVYHYNTKTEKLDFVPRVFGTVNFHSNFTINNICKKYGQKAVDNFNRMVIFDLITNQRDRHINNFAFYNNDLYPLYDNGRCLFWDEDDLEEIESMDIISTFKTNEHGYGWNYVDGVLGMYECRRLINLNVKYQDILDIVKKYYSSKRAKILTNYMYRVYRLIVGVS